MPSVLPSASTITSVLKYALWARSNTDSGSTTFSSAATFASRRMAGFSAIGVASSKCFARWSLQKYGDSNSSWIRITFAPRPAASRISRSALAMLASRSVPQAICVAATVTFMTGRSRWS